jgi:hypothetical protein
MIFQGYFLQITFTQNKFKWKKLNSPISDYSCDNGDFSHVNIIVYQYLVYN